MSGLVTEADPRIDCLEWHVRFHQIHADAGWDPIPRADLEARYVFYYRWLAEQQLIDVDSTSIDRGFELFKSAITNAGWKFIPKICDKFVALDTPERTLKQDEQYLRRRYKAIFGEEA